MNDKNRELQELANETLATTEEYLENAIPLIEKLGTDFYRKPNKKNWIELTHLFGGFAWIIETSKEIDSIKELKSIVGNYTIWYEYVQALADLNFVLPELKKALEDQDNTLIADLLIHAVIPSIEDMLAKLRELGK